MPRPTFSMTVLALFASAEKALEIEGDLLEQAHTKGRLWYLLQLKLTTLALAFNAFLKEPAKILLFSYAIYELVLKLNWWAFNPLRRLIGKVFELDRGAMLWVNDLLNSALAFLLAMLIVKCNPRQGALLILFAIAFMLGRSAILESTSNVLSLMNLALFCMPTALGGMLLMKWLELLSHRNEWSLGARE